MASGALGPGSGRRGRAALLTDLLCQAWPHQEGAPVSRQPIAFSGHELGALDFVLRGRRFLSRVFEKFDKGYFCWMSESSIERRT